MYHPTRGGVRGGRDQFSWDDVKVDKHRENYLGHSIKAPVGRWQKGKDLHWYNRDKNTWSAEMDAAKDEIKRIKEEEDQAMREALGLAPKRANPAQGNRLDKHEFSELVKRGSTAEDLGAGHAEAAHVHGLGFSRAPVPWDDSTSFQPTVKGVAPAPEIGDIPVPNLSPKLKNEEESEDESSRRKRRREERKHEKHERREKREKHQIRHSSDERKHRKHKEKRRVLRTLNKCLSIERLSQPLIGNDS